MIAKILSEIGVIVLKTLSYLLTLGNCSAQIGVNPATNTSLYKRFCMSQITELPIMEAKAKDTFSLLLLQV